MLNVYNNISLNNTNKALMILNLYLEKIIFLEKKVSNCKTTNNNELKSKLKIEKELNTMKLSFISIINGKSEGNDVMILINYTNEMYDNLKKDLNF